MDDAATWTPPAPRPPERRLVAVILVSVGAGFVLVMGSCAALGNMFDPGPMDKVGPYTRQIYAPIPISQAACPYLRRVHDTAERAGQLWWQARNASFDDTTVSKAQIGASLRSFDVALRDAVPHVPQLLATQLTEVRHHVRAGERLLKRVHTAPEYAGRVGQQVTDGYLVLGDASDLVGDACGFQVIPPLHTSPPVS